VISSPVETRPVCTVRICGGLGNQLFQYALGRALALRTDSQLQLDLSFYGKRRHRTFELDKLPIEAEFTLPTRALRAKQRCESFLQKAFRSTKSYQEPHHHYDPHFESVQLPVTIAGYFQSERYFRTHSETIRTELTVPQPEDAESLDIARQMSQCTPTALHIRRGDYITSPSARQVYASCPIDYYTHAMESIPGNDPVFVFSDDTPWAKQNLPAVKQLVFAGENSPRTALADLWLMTQAHHHIIANSSLSWWGAWLAGAQKGTTYAPRQWFVDPTLQDHDLVPNHWVRI